MPLPKYSYQVTVSETEGIKLLSGFVGHVRHGPEELLVPSRVRPSTAAEFLAGRVSFARPNDDASKRGTPPVPTLEVEPTQRCADIVRFYNLSDAVALFTPLLDGREATCEESLRALQAVRLAGDLGMPEQAKAAATSYSRICTQPWLTDVLTLIETFVHLPADAQSKPLEDRLRRDFESQGGEKAVPDEPSPAYLDCQERLNIALPAARHAHAKRNEIKGLPEPAARCAQIARLYVGLDNHLAINWHRWAAFALMQEVRAGNAQHALAGLKVACKDLASAEPESYRNHARARAVRALVFLGGELTPEQSEWFDTINAPTFQLQG